MGTLASVSNKWRRCGTELRRPVASLRRASVGRTALASVLACASISCGTTTASFSAVDIPVASADVRPEPGFLHVTMAPAVALRPMSVSYAGSGQPVGTTGFNAGERVSFDATDFPGDYRLRVDALVCDPAFALSARMETDVVVQVDAGTCTATVVAIHDPTAFSHEEVVGRVSGTAAARQIVTLTPDFGDVRRPIEVAADESGHFEVEGLMPGSYDVEIRYRGEIVATLRAIVEAGETTLIDAGR